MQVEPYLMFNGRCEEAINFYTKAINAEVVYMMRFKECPDPQPPGMLPPGSENKIMHMNFRIGDSSIMASDGQCNGTASFQGFSLTISVKDASQAEKIFTALGEGGQIQMPLGKTFFSPMFGMVADRFGVSWMVIVPGDIK
jgi:PhnB protein